MNSFENGLSPTKGKTVFRENLPLITFVALLIFIERFSNDCRKTKTKTITPTNHNRSKQRDEPITIPSNYLYCNLLKAREK